MNQINLMLAGLCLACAISLEGCRSSYSVTAIKGERFPMTSAYDTNPNPKLSGLLASYSQRVDSIMSPVIGHADMNLQVKRPESPLSNLISDIMLNAARLKTGKPVVLAVMNIGGIRSALTAGDVTYGDAFEVFPFENRLCVLQLTGKDLKILFDNIASVGGEGISGAKLTIDKSGNSVANVVLADGQPIENSKTYWVATNDYLAEGNDKMVAFQQGTNRIYPENATIRQLFVDYMLENEKKGTPIHAATDGRITFVESK